MKPFSAFGLNVRPGFPVLDGCLAEEDPAAPRISLELESVQQLDDRWSGSIAPRPWQGRLGDGQELTIEWGREGDLLFGYGRRARFRLDAERTRLGCAPAEAGEVAWRRVLLTKVLPNVAIARGYEALHASAVLTESGVVAVVASSGTGKSTLALEMVRRGRPLFADDVLVLGRGEGRVEAHPAAPVMNLAAGAGGLLEGIDRPPREGKGWFAAGAPATGPSPLAALVLLDRAPGMPLGARPRVASYLAVAPFMLGLPDDGGRERSRFELYADLVEGPCQVLGLTADLDHRPAELVDALEEALGLERSALPGGVA